MMVRSALKAATAALLRPLGAEGASREVLTHPLFKPLADYLAKKEAATSNAAPQDARTAGAKFVGMVQEASKRREISYDAAWRAIEKEQPELFAAMSRNDPLRNNNGKIKPANPSEPAQLRTA